MASLRLIVRSLCLLTLATLALALTTCSERPGVLGRIDKRGALRVATVNSAATYYLDADGPAGFEYDLARSFADSLGLRLKMLVLADRHAVLNAVASGRADIGVGLAVSNARRQRVRFTPAYAHRKLEAVYRVYQDKPASLADLSGHLTLAADTAFADWLAANHPRIDFSVDRHANTEELMDRVAGGELAATVANADMVAMNQRYYPKLRVAFVLPAVRQRLAWSFAPDSALGKDDALYNRGIAFLEKAKTNGRMRILRDRYFGYIQRLGFVGGSEFARQVDKRLDKWRGHFKSAATKYGLDWRLLAAIGYQESRWDKDAVSPTTVRGIMMLTRAAAKDVDVSNRRDPQQSINGGARYFTRMLKRLPYEIKPPDRTWFALAAYNIGYGHVMDARRLLAARKRDPNLWINLREALPWLTQERYMAGTRHGYARGLEAATYVGNVRAYYDILEWMNGDRRSDKHAALAEKRSEAGAGPAAGVGDKAPARDALPAIAIDSPAF